MTDYSFTAEDGKLISAKKWEIQNPKGIVQILHGMADHISRYNEFAEFLNSRGFLVAGEDHRGHGETAGTLENTGYFADSDGWNKVIRDNLRLADWLRDENPDIPYYIFGHSMGSFLTRKIIAEHPEKIAKVILSGSGDFSDIQVKLLTGIAKIQKIFFGKKAEAKLLDKLSFSKLNDQFKPGRTGFEWISRDEAKVDEYLADPFCGFICRIGLYMDFADGISFLKSDKAFKDTPNNLPILFYSGDHDPVGGNGSLISAVAEKYKSFGCNNVELVLNKDGRHESLNEINRDEIYKFMADWLER